MLLYQRTDPNLISILRPIKKNSTPIKENNSSSSSIESENEEEE